MKINSINNIQNSNNIYNQNFNGLWGKTRVVYDFDRTLGIPTQTETSYYYPYKDEDMEEVKNIISANNKAYIDYTNGEKYIVKECKLCSTLPFEQGNWEDYSRISDSSKMTNILKKVHRFVADKYKNANGEQETAVNNMVKYRLNMVG